MASTKQLEMMQTASEVYFDATSNENRNQFC